MTGRNDISEILDGWLAEGPTQMSDRAIDSTLDIIDHTMQRRVLRLPWREHPMTVPVRMAAAALVAALAIGGFIAMRSTPIGVGQSSASPSIGSPTPTAPPPVISPQAIATQIPGTVLAHGAMALAPGATYSTPAFSPAVEIKGAPTWWLGGDGHQHVWMASGPNEPSGPDQYTVSLAVVTRVLPPVGGGSSIAVPADLVGWLRARSDLSLATPTSITVGGLRGTALVGTVRAGASTNTGGAINVLCSGDFACTQEQGDEIGFSPGRAFEIVVIPLAGRTLVIAADGPGASWTANAATIEAFLAGLSFPGASN